MVDDSRDLVYRDRMTDFGAPCASFLLYNSRPIPQCYPIDFINRPCVCEQLSRGRLCPPFARQPDRHPPPPFDGGRGNIPSRGDVYESTWGHVPVWPGLRPTPHEGGRRESGGGESTRTREPAGAQRGGAAYGSMMTGNVAPTTGGTAATAGIFGTPAAPGRDGALPASTSYALYWAARVWQAILQNPQMAGVVARFSAAGVGTDQARTAYFASFAPFLMSRWPSPKELAQLGSDPTVALARRYTAHLMEGSGQISGFFGGGESSCSAGVNITQQDLKWYLTRWLQLHAIPDECRYGFPGTNAIVRRPISPSPQRVPLSAHDIICSPEALGQCGQPESGFHNPFTGFEATFHNPFTGWSVIEQPQEGPQAPPAEGENAKSSSALPIVLGLGVAAAVIAGGVYYASTSGKG